MVQGMNTCAEGWDKPGPVFVKEEIVVSGEAYMDETHLLVKCDVEEKARHRNELISEGKATGKPVSLRDDSPVGDDDTLKNRIALHEWKGIQNYLLTGSGDFTNNICEREMRTVGTLRNNGLFWGSHVSAERLSVIFTIVRSALMNSLNVYQYMVYCLKTIRSYKGDLADLLANKWKPSDTELMPILA